MYEVALEPRRNCLVVTLKGFIKDQEAEEAAREVMSLAKELEPGFTVINDISEFKPTTPESAENIRKAQAFVSRLGVERVIRVVGAALVTEMQFRRTQREAGADYEVIEVASIEDAKRMVGMV